MKYLIITEADWQSLRDEVLSLAACCLKAFGEESKHTEWLHNGDVCRLLGISKRTLQHYRDTSVLPFAQIGHKCYYKREDVERLLCVKSDKTTNTTKAPAPCRTIAIGGSSPTRSSPARSSTKPQTWKRSWRKITGKAGNSKAEKHAFENWD